EMRQDGAAAVAMEVSSHALAMGRVGGARFDAAVFTNLTRDHLDYHNDFEDYFAAKRKLFELLKPGRRAAFNVDDPYGRRLAAEIPDALTFGERGEVAAREVSLTTAGIHGTLITPRGEVPFTTPLLGRYNLSNLLAAAAAAETLELPHEAVAAAFAAQRPVPGRLEPIDHGQPFAVFIDYAHTDAALEAALRSVREVVGGGKVAVVFGCGGDRDPGKRPLMGKIAGELADLVIATSDNPRSEDPLAILAAVEEGLKQSGNQGYRLIPDRREAIRQAIAEAEPGWAVLVAGKGHETYQILGDRKLPFSDLEETAKALEARRG
ncbi:MAG: UDP-N-acetylmuramoyl-L-alanyl-D-glutamate--2,6-diaminopimelate ligase, partial [Acidobacteria bacterium]